MSSYDYDANIDLVIFDNFNESFFFFTTRSIGLFYY